MKTINTILVDGTYTAEKESKINFDGLLTAISTGVSKAKGKLSNGVKWTYNYATGVVRFSYRFSKRVVNTVVDGIRKGIEWIKAQLSKMFGGK